MIISVVVKRKNFQSTIFIHEKFIIYYVIEDIHEPQDNVFP